MSTAGRATFHRHCSAGQTRQIQAWAAASGRHWWDRWRCPETLCTLCSCLCRHNLLACCCTAHDHSSTILSLIRATLHIVGVHVTQYLTSGLAKLNGWLSMVVQQTVRHACTASWQASLSTSTHQAASVNIPEHPSIASVCKAAQVAAVRRVGALRVETCSNEEQPNHVL